MHKKAWLLAILLALTALAVEAQASTPRESFVEAYVATFKAAQAGGNVEPLVAKLNEALSLIKKAEAASDPEEAAKLNSEALSILSQVVEEAPKIAAEGEQARLIGNALLAVSIAALLASAYAAYRYGPSLFLKLWVKAKSKYRVKVVREEVKEGEEHGSMLLSEEVWAVVLAIIVVASVFAFSQAYLAGRVIEPFSELGVLGPHAKIADYPRRVVAGDAIKLYLYVGNHLGYPAYYKVLVKVGNQTTKINPAPLKPIAEYEVVLNHNSTWLHPIQLTLTKPGEDQRVIFELWIYNLTTHSFTYHKRWCQLWIDVIPPP